MSENPSPDCETNIDLAGMGGSAYQPQGQAGYGGEQYGGAWGQAQPGQAQGQFHPGPGQPPTVSTILEELGRPAVS